jgi:hypothetical protein
MARNTLIAGLVAGTLAMPGAAGASTFNISLSVDAAFSADQISVFTAVVAAIEKRIVGYLEPIAGFTGPTIAVNTFTEAASGTLAYASVSGIKTSASYVYASSGSVTFDTEDLTRLEDKGHLGTIFGHELAHALGFGTLWNATGITGAPSPYPWQNLYVNGSGQYTGAFGLAAYRKECDASATFVPVELDGGMGTANAHWDERWACGSDAVMTGMINLSQPAVLTETSIASFADLGYVVLPPVPLPAGGLLLISAFGAAAALRRRSAEQAGTEQGLPSGADLR